MIKRIKNTVPWTYIINDLNGEEIIGTFYEKEFRNTNQEEFRTEKVIKKKGNKLHVKWKGYISSFALKLNLASLKTEVDKLDIDELTPVPNDFVKLSNVVKNDVVKNTAYDKLVTKVDNIDTTKFVLKTTYDIDKSEAEKRAKLPIDLLKNDSPATKSELVAVENKILDANSVIKKTDLNAKITEIENKIPSITSLATNSALIPVKNEIPDVSSLIKKTDYNTKISEIERKVSDHNHGIYITTLEFNNLAAGVFTARLA